MIKEVKLEWMKFYNIKEKTKKNEKMEITTAKKITIETPMGTGILTKADDGKWDISLNGQSGGPLHYDQAQLEKIVTDARNNGANVIVE